MNNIVPQIVSILVPELTENHWHLVPSFSTKTWSSLWCYAKMGREDRKTEKSDVVLYRVNLPCVWSSPRRGGAGQTQP